MQYYKKVLVLKETEKGFSNSRSPVSGIFRLESEDGVATLSFSVVNLLSAKGGEYFLFFADGKRVLTTFSLGARPSSFTTPLDSLPNTDKGVSVGLFFFGSLPTLIAFSQSDNSAADAVELKKLVAAHFYREKTEKEKELPKPPVNPEPQIPVAPPFTPPNGAPNPVIPPVFVPTVNPNDNDNDEYDDEVVATENYFVRDEDFEQKLKIIERIDNEILRNQDALRCYRKQETTGKDRTRPDCAQNEGYGQESASYSARNPFFEKVKDKLENLFSRFPAEENLSKTVPESKWIKINYADNKYYVVGIVKKDGKEKYVCYGVPAAYSSNPPKELKGFCSFVPSSVFKLKGDGYWMMFQDATTGTCIRM